MLISTTPSESLISIVLLTVVVISLKSSVLILQEQLSFSNSSFSWQLVTFPITLTFAFLPSAYENNAIFL